jgi:succinate dehydrogenase/fumarate reductase flavoprotein subunit
MLVQGADAGRNAGKYALKADVPRADEAAIKDIREKALLPLEREKGLKPAQVRRRVQETAHRLLGPVRNEEELKNLIDFIHAVKKEELPHLATASKSRVYNKEWLDAIELESILHLLEAAALSALHRTESRGVHYREDYPHTDNDNWLQESVVKLENGSMAVTKRPVTVTSITPPRGVQPYLEMLKKLIQAHSNVGGHH